MAKGFFRERKHYTLQAIAKELDEKAGETRRLVGILKKYGVVKAVRRKKLEFEDLSNEDIVLADVVDHSEDIEYVFDYVGVILLEGHVFKCYPKYIVSTAEPLEEMKQVLKVIKKYNSSEQLIYLFNGEDENKVFNKLAVSLHLLEEYYAYGLYTNQHEIIESNGEGEILWDKTMNESFALMQNNKPYYVDLRTQCIVNNDFDYYRRLHEYILTACSKELKEVGLLQLFDISEVDLTNAEISDFGDNAYILYRLQSEIRIQYVTRKRNLLKAIYTYISNDRTDEEDISYSLYGTNSFNLVWEKVCAKNFGSVLDAPISELPLHSAPDFETSNTLRSVIEAPCWHRKNPKSIDFHVGTLKPDMICVYPVDEQKQQYCFGIYDAKYYCIDFVQGKDGQKVVGQPGVGDVTKQYLYQLAYDEFIVKQGYDYVQNMFFCPQEYAEKDYGFVEMEMFQQIADKRLEDIAIVKLCAAEMYDIYLSNRKIKGEEIGKYIPMIGRREIKNQNFANRMMEYLRRIVRGSRMAEEMLEMRSERGKLIYPEQIQRELGARIIYDAICPVACNAFYGFDPYEKDDYNGMAAETAGYSYERCNQLADVALAIEKVIRCMPEQDLHNVSILGKVLKKCFEGKDQINSMAGGRSLEKLTEKIMELIMDVFL